MRLLTDDSLDASAVTVTRVTTSRNLRHAQVWVSVRAEEDGQKKMLAIIRKYRLEVQSGISRDLTLKYTPRLRFNLDTSLKMGDSILQILREIDEDD